MSSSLAKKAYQQIPPQTYRNTKNNPSKIKENYVLDYTRKEIMENHQKMPDWIKTIKMPIYIQNILTVMDIFSKPRYFDALNNIRKANSSYKLENYMDYYDEFKVFLNDKKLFDQTLSVEQQKKKWAKSYCVLNATFYLLCYKRLNKIFENSVEDSFHTEFIKEIDELEESEIISFIIYRMIDRKYTKKDLENI